MRSGGVTRTILTSSTGHEAGYSNLMDKVIWIMLIHNSADLCPLGRVGRVLPNVETAATVSMTYPDWTPAVNTHHARVDDAGVPGHDIR